MTLLPLRSMLIVSGSYQREKIWEVARTGPFKAFETEAHTSEKRATGFDTYTALLPSCISPIVPHSVSILPFWNSNGI